MTEEMTKKREEGLKAIREKGGWIISILKENGFKETENEYFPTLSYSDDLKLNTVIISLHDDGEIRVSMRGKRFRTECKLEEIRAKDESRDAADTLFVTENGYMDLLKGGIDWEEAKEYLREHGYTVDSYGYAWHKKGEHDEFTMIILSEDFIYAFYREKELHTSRKWFLRNFQSVYDLDKFFNFDCAMADAYWDPRLRVLTKEEAEQMEEETKKSQEEEEK